MKSVCVDAGFLIGVYDERDEHHEKAKNHFLQIFEGGDNRMLIPWPILYEAVSTQMVKNRSRMLRLERDWNLLHTRNRLELISDCPYRDDVIRAGAAAGLPPARFAASVPNGIILNRSPPSAS